MSDVLLIRVEQEDAHVRLYLAGRFDAGAEAAFSAACEPLLADVAGRLFILDLRDLVYLSSAGLRLMLALRARLLAADRRIELHGATGMPLEVLTVARFERLFHML